jgi:hypothetical protein
MITDLFLIAGFLAGVALVPWNPSLMQETMECHEFDNFQQPLRERYQVSNAEATYDQYVDAINADNLSRSAVCEFPNGEMYSLTYCRNGGIVEAPSISSADLGWRINVPPNCACCHLLTDSFSWTNRLEWTFSIDSADEYSSGQLYFGYPQDEAYVTVGMNMDGCPQDCPSPAQAFELRRTLYYRLKVSFTRTAGGTPKAQLSGQYRYWHRENGVETNEGPFPLNQLVEGMGAWDSGLSLNILSQRSRVFKALTRMFWVCRAPQDGASEANTRVRGEVFGDAYELRSLDQVEGLNAYSVDWVDWMGE